MRTSEQRIDGINNKVKQQKRRKAITATSIVGATLALIFVLNLVLFVPFTVGDYNISAYKGSEYYKLMNTIGELTYTKYKTNNFHQWGLADIFNKTVDGPDVMWPMSPGAPSTPDSSMEGTTSPSGSSGSAGSSGEHYEETTKNQVEGVTEGDLFKRSSEHIYYLDWRTGYNEPVEPSNKYNKEQYRYVPSHYILRTYRFDKDLLEQVSELDIFTTDTDMRMDDGGEIYLSEDCKTVTVILEETTYLGIVYTTVVNIDVSNPESPVEANRQSVSGEFVSARMIDDTLLLVTNFTVRRNPDFSNPCEYLPQVGDLDNLTSIPMKDIALPDDATTAQYSIVTSFNGSTLTLKDAVALFSYTTTIYVSEHHLFATREKTEQLTMESVATSTEGGKYASFKANYSIVNTEIACVAYDSEDLDIRGTITANGTVVNQYSLDEYDSVLRVFTTSNKHLLSWSSNSYTDETTQIYKQFDLDECNLYCYKLDNFELIAQVENFADEDESVKSVRFDQNVAYVCTAVVDYSWNNMFWATDPVFQFDLSNYGNITSTDTGTIPGYSLSLTAFSDGTLIGIGYGDNSLALKIELYRAGSETVDCVAKYELMNCEFATDYKACFIDAEHGLVGLGVSYIDAESGMWKDKYLLLRYDGELFEEVGMYDFELMTEKDYFTGELNDMRACLVDGYMYIFCDSRANAFYID
ncbi:MAG: beta-propeller domain-containing protein [Clostridiales bacterium]|nr:beta-propeller domain-containing protein [Clostridiales bacterium]